MSGHYYPCDGSGICTYESWDNPDRMYFCRDHCGMGVDGSDDYEIWEETLEWVSMTQMIEWGIDSEVADYLTAMGQPQIQHDTETDEIYCDGEFAYTSVNEFVKDANAHKDEICE